jgi:LuxR family transcriptional regulator, quorum-sensing system regulator BjaR1
MTDEAQLNLNRMERGFDEEILSLQTQFDIFRYMRRLVERYNMVAFLVLDLPDGTSKSLAKNSIITSLPPEFTAQFDRDMLLDNSPVVKQLRSSAAPFSYDLDNQPMQRGDKEKAAVAEALVRKFKIPRGAYFPTHDANGVRGAVGILGDRPRLELIEFLELHMISTLVYDRIAQIRAMDDRPKEALSERELDCLNWTAAGKTSVEIAGIVGLSEHTVNHYLNRATKKLDTVNRTQAVAKALRTGLIS